MMPYDLPNSRASSAKHRAFGSGHLDDKQQPSYEFDVDDELIYDAGLDHRPLLLPGHVERFRAHGTGPTRRLLRWHDRPSYRLAVATAILIVLFVVASAFSTSSAARAPVPAAPDTALPFSASESYPIDVRSPYAGLQESQTTRWLRRRGKRCVEQWIAEGQLCASGNNDDEMIGRDDEGKVHVIWTWVNGTQANVSPAGMASLADWRDALSHEVGNLTPSPATTKKQAATRGRRNQVELEQRRTRRSEGGQVVRHFREHDELRYSIRSVLASLSPASIAGLHLIVNDWPADASLVNNATLLGVGTVAGAAASAYLSKGPNPLLAQVPAWLDTNQAIFAPTESADASSEPTIRTAGLEVTIHPSSSIFRPGAGSAMRSGNQSVEAAAAAAGWRASVLPTFNSLSVESQLSNLLLRSKAAPLSNGNLSDALSDATWLVMSDDYFLSPSSAQFNMADVSSRLMGTILRMQRGFNVPSLAPVSSDAENGSGRDSDGETAQGRVPGLLDGEWRGLGYSAYLLDERFGARARPYIAHVAKSVSPALLKEMAGVWNEEMMETAASRFRGQAPREVEIWLLLYHYTIEKHREALLWSFIVARHDLNDDEVLSLSERQAMLVSLGFSSPAQEILNASTPRRSTLDDLPALLRSSNLTFPAQTTYDFTSMDGYALFVPDEALSANVAGPWPSYSASDQDLESPRMKLAHPPPCSINLIECFGSSFTASDGVFLAENVLRRVAYEQPRCGDCIIVQLVAKSGKLGLDAFLPPAELGADDEDEAVEVKMEVLGGREQDWRRARLNLSRQPGVSRRRQATHLISRYSYTIGSSASRFISMRGPGTAQSLFTAIDHAQPSPAFLAVNDDITVGAKDVDRMMRRWFAQKWPVASRWEKKD